MKHLILQVIRLQKNWLMKFATRPYKGCNISIVYLPGYTKKPWQDYEPYLAHLDVDGYNYFLENQSKFFVRDSATAHRFETEHAKHPAKTFIVTEYTPISALENLEYAKQHPYLLGSFKWTAMDYIGEAGIGRPVHVACIKKAA